MNFRPYSKLIVIHLFIFTALSLAGQASASSGLQPASVNAGAFGPVAKDCNHQRILCFQGNDSIFAVKGPLTPSQMNNLCPSTPKQSIFKRHPLPIKVMHSVIIVNVGDSVFAYNPDQYRFSKSSFSEPLPKFSYVLCGTAENKPSYGRHKRADMPIPLNEFLANSTAFDAIQNLPENQIFKASDRRYSFRDVILGDSLGYFMSLFPASEVNYEISGINILGYDLIAQDGDIQGKFDKAERLYDFSVTLSKKDRSFIEILEEFVNGYGEPVVKGGATLEHDLEPKNNVQSGSYIWKIQRGSYLTLTINTENISLKMVDINKAK